MKLSALKFFKRFDELKVETENTLLIFDRRLLRVSREFGAWSKNFPARYPVASGEDLKELEAFPRHAQKLARLVEDVPARRLTVIAVGGGSVGDFAGFFASIYKRGVRLIHVPSTWLAAIDSSHGGKTALNNARVKNQFGTFYPADTVVLVRSLLVGQPHERALDAMGELAKIALIDGGAWTKKLERANGDVLWTFLKPAIHAKLKIVAQDPHELKGLRQVLNLGHTVGHIFETAYGWTHGQSVAQGLYFAINFSEARGSLKTEAAARARGLLEHLGVAHERGTRLSAKKFTELALRDKKRARADRLTFIFLRAWGRVERIEITTDALLAEARRQGVV